MNLKNAKALVTGGSEGIGKGIAKALVAEGCDVEITARRADLLETAAGEIGCGFQIADVGEDTGLIYDAVRHSAVGRDLSGIK